MIDRIEAVGFNDKERENIHLTLDQVHALRNKLLGEKERILNKDPMIQNIGQLDKNELMDPLDEASINVQASHDLRFRNRENFYLKKINKTLSKIDDGSYGLCDECGDTIDYPRLNARITADMCIRCKEESEQNEKNNAFQKRSKSLGKTIYELGKR